MKSLVNSLKDISNIIEETDDIFNINNPSEILVGTEFGDGKITKARDGWVWIGPSLHKDSVNFNEYDLEKIPYDKIIVDCDTVYLYVYEELNNKIISCQNNVVIQFINKTTLNNSYINGRFFNIIPSKNYSLIDSGITSQESILIESTSNEHVFPTLKNSEIKSYKDNIIIDCNYPIEKLLNHKFDPVKFFNLPKDLTHLNVCSTSGISKDTSKMTTYRLFSKKHKDYNIYIKGNYIKLKNGWIAFISFN